MDVVLLFCCFVVFVVFPFPIPFLLFLFSHRRRTVVHSIIVTSLFLHACGQATTK